MPNIKIRNLIPATGGDISSGNFLPSALNTGEGHDRVTRKVTYEQVVSGGAVFADFSEGLQVSGNPVITGFRSPTPDGGLVASGDNDIVYLGAVEADDTREVHIQRESEDAIIIDSNNDVKIEKNLISDDGEIRAKIGRFTDDVFVNNRKVLVSTPAPGGGIGFGGGSGDDDPVAFTQNGETRIKLESDGSISFNNVSNFKAGASFDPYITLAVQTDAPSSLANKLYNKGGNLWWEGWQIAPAVDMTNGFSPEEDNTGNVGTSTNAWANGSFHNLSSKGTADISTLRAANLSVTQKIEYTAGSKALQGESSPTGADIGGSYPYNGQLLNLYALNEPIFFGFNAFGNVVKKEKDGPWLKVNQPDDVYYTFNKLVHTKLSNGKTRIHMACLSSGSSGSVGRYSDDLGETWQNGLGLSRSEYYGTGRNKKSSGSFSNDIQHENDAVALYNPASTYAIKADYTIAQFADNAKNGDNTIAAKLMHEYLYRFYGSYQCHTGDDIFASNWTNPRDVITEENMRNFKFVVNDKILNTSKYYGQNNSGIQTRELNQSAMGAVESRHDLLLTFGNHYPGADNIYVYAHGIKKVLSALKNGVTINDAWFASQNENDFWMAVVSTHSGIALPFGVSPDLTVGGTSNNDIIIISGQAMPASIVSYPEEFLDSQIYTSPGRKSWSHGYGSSCIVKYIDEDTLSLSTPTSGELFEIDTKSLSNALTVTNGNTLDTGAAAACITRIKNYVSIGGVSTELAGGGGELSNPDENARNAIFQYVHNHKDGYMVGIGNEGFATSRNLAIESYDNTLSIWNNTTANGFTVPDFKGNSYYHPDLKKLHFDLKKSYTIATAPLSVDAQQQWGDGFVGNVPSVWLTKPVWGDSSINIYSGQNGHSEYISEYTNSNINWTSRHGFVSTGISNTAYSGHRVNYTPSSPRGNFNMTAIQFPGGEFMTTIYFRVNGGTARNEPYGHYLDGIGLKRADGSKNGRLWSVTNPGYNGDMRTYGGALYTINNQYMFNSNRTDKSTHPTSFGAFVFPYNSSTSTDFQAGADAWLEQTDSFFRIAGIYKRGQPACYAFQRQSEAYDFENDDVWDVSIVSNAGPEIPISVNRSVANNYVYLDFTVPSTPVYDFLIDLGLTEAEINSTTITNPKDSSQREFRGWFQVANKTRTEGYRKGFKMRDGEGSEWHDFTFNWESYNKLRSAGDLGFIFSNNSQPIYQMSNYDLIVTTAGGWKVVSIDGLKGENDLYINDPTFFDHAVKAQYFGKGVVDMANYANNSLSGKPSKNMAALSLNKHIFNFGSKRGIITTDGTGNLTNIQRIIPPAGMAEEGFYNAFEGNGTLYYYYSKRLFYTDLETVVLSNADEISPVWEEIITLQTGLQNIFGFTYHPESDVTYLLGESGLFSKSVNGRTDWAIEVAPQLAFASQPNTGIYKDLNHDLHIVHKGDLSLSFTEETIGSIKPFGFGTKTPDLSSNLTIRTQENSTTTGDYKIVVLFEDLEGGAAGHISVDTEDNKVLLSDASDYRLKTNISNFEKPIERLMSLKPCSFQWKKNHNTSEGFIAHEVQQVVPYAVRGIKDEVKTETKIIPAEYKEIKIKEEVVDETTNEVSLETVVKEIIVQEEQKVIFETPVYQGIDYSKIVPLLTAALQETVKEVQALKNKIDELENQ